MKKTNKSNSLQARIQKLEDHIVQARNDYYNTQPTVSDEVYDAWIDELTLLKQDSPAVTAVGAPPVSAWKKVVHTIPMGSLSKVQTPEEFVIWVRKVSRKQPEEWVVADKLDGISISLRYENGELIQALTRGDSATGEDITSNLLKMKGISPTLLTQITGNIRGEIMLLKSDHQKYFPGTSNPRNTASGTAKRLDGTGSEHLTVICYQAIIDGVDFATEKEQFEYLENLGFKTPKWYLIDKSSKDSVIDLWNQYQDSTRDALPYEIDGLVVRLNDMEHQISLGDSDGRPCGAVAFKFKPAMKETTLRNIVWQVGSIGRITPVAEFDTVNVAGADISRASLYNAAYIKTLGLDIGAGVNVCRANDVIPRIHSVIKSTGTVAKLPKKCPECGSEVEMQGEYLVCLNVAECPAQTLGRIQHWVKEMGIMEWGESLIEKVIDAELVECPADLYRLSVEDLVPLERMGESSAKNAIREIEKSREMSLEKLMGAIGIPFCGTTTMATVVAAGYNTFEKLYAAKISDFERIPTMGNKRAECLFKWLMENKHYIDNVLDAGIVIKEKVMGNLTGKSVCFTGKSERKRAELQKIAEDAGGVVKSSVGKGLTYLVMADPESTSSKAVAARKLGTKCISENDFVKMAGLDE